MAQRARREHHRQFDRGMLGLDDDLAVVASERYAAGEHLLGARELLDATYRDSGCPNNDML
jgi:hypothetical protein